MWRLKGVCFKVSPGIGRLKGLGISVLFKFPGVLNLRIKYVIPTSS